MHGRAAYSKQCRAAVKTASTIAIFSSRGLSANRKAIITLPRPQSVIGGGVEGVSAEFGKRISR
eukprot:1547953-Pyramimonas_sp.AAC.1